MPINNGRTVRHHGHGFVEITGPDTATEQVIAFLQPGTLSYRSGLEERRAEMDDGAFTDTVMAGDERESEISFTLKATTSSHDASDIMDRLEAAPDATDGTIQLVTLSVVTLDFKGASVGKRLTWNNCYVTDAPQYQGAGAGAEPDTIAVTLRSLDARPTVADYSAV